MEFIRLVRNLIPINLVAFLAFLHANKCRKNELIIIVFLTIHLLTSWWFLYGSLWEDAVVPVVENNYVFDLFA